MHDVAPEEGESERVVFECNDAGGGVRYGANRVPTHGATIDRYGICDSIISPTARGSHRGDGGYAACPYPARTPHDPGHVIPALHVSFPVLSASIDRRDSFVATLHQ